MHSNRRRGGHHFVVNRKNYVVNALNFVIIVSLVAGFYESQRVNTILNAHHLSERLNETIYITRIPQIMNANKTGAVNSVKNLLCLNCSILACLVMKRTDPSHVDDIVSISRFLYADSALIILSTTGSGHFSTEISFFEFSLG
uniref:Uncharacterized protein n=1 Tax=Romanomermis culicivorax TaxID=13658 RepID=A0A915J4T5_ROMCU